MTHHPMRDARIHVFAGIDEAAGKFIARFAPYDTYPILFIGSSADDVRQKAEDFRADAIARNEATYIARVEALTKARAARKAKEAA